MSRTFGSIIIGSGQAGPFLAARLAKTGQTVALVERKFLGGRCVKTGCTPTKAMVASAKVAHMVREAARFGVHLQGYTRLRDLDSRGQVRRADDLPVGGHNGWPQVRKYGDHRG